MSRKPRSDSKLKQLSESQQDELWELDDRTSRGRWQTAFLQGRKMAVEAALEWNHQRGFISMKWNEEQELNLWHITQRRVAENQAHE